jgi:hypothetical protein
MTAQSIRNMKVQPVNREGVGVYNLKLLGGVTAVIGAISFLIGAILWNLSGTDIDQAVTNGEMADFLTTAANNQTIVVANLSFWIVGAVLLGIAGATMVKISRPSVWSQIARVSFQTAVPLVIISYVTMLAVVVQIAPDTSPTSVLLAEVVGWLGSRGDWVATILIIGLGPLALSQASKGDWLPNWLVGLGYATGICGLLTAIGIFANGLGTYGFIIIPVGLIWMLGAGVSLLRNARNEG